MKHIRLIREAETSMWAIVPASLRCIIEGLYEGFEAVDPKLFHATTIEDKEILCQNVGDAVEGSSYSYVAGNTGVLMVDGPIIPKATMFSNASGMVSVDTLTSEFKAFESNSRIDNIVMVVDSPGGVVTGVGEFANTIKSSSKPTTSFVYGMAASAAYWIASAADKVVGSPSSMAGSIGAVLTVKDSTKADEKKGVKKLEFVSSQSPFKRVDPNTDEGKDAIQTMVDDQAEVFISDVAAFRGVSADTVKSNFGKGAMLIASKAVQAGMIDAVGRLDTVIQSKKDFNAATSFVAEEDNKPLTLEVKMAEKETVTAVEDTSIVEATVKAAVSAERDRIKGIEALSCNFIGAHPDAIAAATKVINARKYDSEATEALVAMEAFKAATEGQVKALEQHAEPARANAEAAAKIGEAKAAEDNEAIVAAQDEERASGIAKHLGDK